MRATGLFIAAGLNLALDRAKPLAAHWSELFDLAQPQLASWG
jgi:hypothetical protein